MTRQPNSVVPFRIALLVRAVCLRGLSALVQELRRFIALTRLSLSVVCEQSVRLGRYDYHTYRDDVDGANWTTLGNARCKRCGKRFRL